LPGLPESRIAPLLEDEDVRRWADEAERAPRRSRPRSRVARQIDRRDRYEATLEHYARADAAELVRACRDLDEALPGDPRSQLRPERIERLLFDVLDREVAGRLHALDPADEEEEFVRQLSEIRQLLDRAEPAHPVGDLRSPTDERTSHRWKALDAALRYQADRLAQTVLDEARALAEKDQLRAAVQKASQAEEFGRPEVSRRARALREKWEAELKLRTDPNAEKQSWQRIQAWRSQEGREIELWAELQTYQRRFPAGPHAAEIGRLVEETKRSVEEKIPQALRHAASLLEREEWDQARRYLDRLENAPMPADQRPVFDKLRGQLADLEQRAAREFLLLGSHTRLLTEEDVTAALSALPEILAMDPDHHEARALLERARRQADLRAEKLLRSAAYFKTRNPEASADRLRRVLRLDPDGPYGRKARQWLGES
jgi:hypothetical protein